VTGSAAVHAEVVPAAVFLLLVGESLEPGTGPVAFLGTRAGAVGRGRGGTVWLIPGRRSGLVSRLRMGLPRRRVRRSLNSASAPRYFSEMAVDVDGQADVGLEVGRSACFDDLEFDLIGEAPLELGHQLRFGPLEDGRGLAKLGSVGSDGARLLEIMEVEGGVVVQVGISEHSVELVGVAGEVVHPGGRIGHIEVRLDPLEGSSSEERSRI
jgi:hypothetical protein